MGKNQRDRQKPKKLTDFLTDLGSGRKKDGAGGLRVVSAHARPLIPENAISEHIISEEKNDIPSPTSSLTNPSVSDYDRSPVKQRPRLSGTNSHNTIASVTPSPAYTAADTECMDSVAVPIESYPTSVQPLSAADMKDMLLSLKESLSKEMHSCVSNLINELKSELYQIGHRVTHVENKNGGICRII